MRRVNNKEMLGILVVTFELISYYTDSSDICLYMC